MVDYTIFKRMHSQNPIFNEPTGHLGESAMNSDEPPEGDFLALLPPHVHGFNLHTKAWGECS